MNPIDLNGELSLNQRPKKSDSSSKSNVLLNALKLFDEDKNDNGSNEIEKEQKDPLSSILPKPMEDGTIPSPLLLTDKHFTDFKISSMSNLLLETNNLVQSCPNSDIEDSKKELEKNDNVKLKSIRKELFQSKRRTNRILSNQDTKRKTSSDEEEEVIHINRGEGDEKGEGEDDDDEYYLLREENDEPQYPNKHYSTSILATMKSYI